MRDLRGMHWPNVSFDDADACLAAIGERGAVTLLHTELGAYERLRHNAPERLIHVRMYTPNWTQVDARTWAEVAVDTLGLLVDDRFLCVSFANEQNLHYEAGDGDAGNQPRYRTVTWYERVATWNMAVLRRFDQLASGRRCLTVTSAFAQGHEPPGYAPDGEYTIPPVREMLHAFDLVGIHPYAELNWHPQSGANGTERLWYMLRPFRPIGFKNATDPGGVVSQYPHLTYLVTETGTFTHSDTGRTDETWGELEAFYRACAASRRVVGITPFVWATDATHPQNNMQPNDELRRRFASMPPYLTTASLPVRHVVPVEPPLLPPSPAPLAAFNPHGFDINTEGALYKLAVERREVITSNEREMPGTGAVCLVTTGALLIWTPHGGAQALPFDEGPDHR